MKPLAIIIAGPQSSGKTHALNFLSLAYKNTYKYEEVNPYTVVGKHHMGAVHVTCALEKKILEHDMSSIAKLSQVARKTVFLIETGPFHLAYLPNKCPGEKIGPYVKKYKQALFHFDVYTIFIDTKPSVSWNRRKNEYESRINRQIQKNKMPRKQARCLLASQMDKYRKNIKDLYPLWHWSRSLFSYKEVVVENNSNNLPWFEKQISSAYQSIRSYAK